MKIFKNFVFLRHFVKKKKNISPFYALGEAFLQGIFLGVFCDLVKIFMDVNQNLKVFPTERFYFVFFTVFILMTFWYLILSNKNNSK